MVGSIHLIFTYWVLIWFLAYYITPYDRYNPKFALILGLFVNAIILIKLLMNGVNTTYIIGFMFAITVTKLVPLYLVREKSFNKEDILFTIVLFIAYLTFFYVNERNNLDRRMKEFDQFLLGRGKSPIMRFFTQKDNSGSLWK